MSVLVSRDRRTVDRRASRAIAVGLIGVSVASAFAQFDAPPAAADVTPGCVVDTTGVLGWWRGEDDLFPVIGPDLSGSVSFGDALVGRGLVFDATSAVSVDAFPAVSAAVTVEMWVKPVDEGFTGRTQALMTRWDFPSTDDSARAFALLLDPFANLTWSTDETSLRRPEELRASVPQIFDGAFHHVAATWDSTATTLYFDGVPVASKSSPAGMLNPAPTTQFRLGSKAGVGDPFQFTGTLDEPTVWGRALTAAEIAAIHLSGANGKCTFVPVQRAKLIAGAPAPPGIIDEFGYSVGTSGATIVVGAPLSSAKKQFGGVAYVFSRAGAAWAQQAVLVASDHQNSDQFGHSVAMDGDTIVVGSYGNDLLGGPGNNFGAAYVYTRTGTTWTQQAKLFSDDAAVADGFGYSVAITADTIVIGTPLDDDPVVGANTGSAYVFTRTGTTWTQQAKLTATDLALADQFGVSVGIDNDAIVVGSPADDDAGADSGSAYVFTRTGTTWTQQAKATSADPAAGDFFGYSVGIENDAIVVGSPADDDAGADSGSAYVFTRTGTTWTQQAKVTSADAAGGDGFGIAVAIKGVTVVAGAFNDDDAGADSGSAYVFTRSATTWSELTKLVALDAGVGDYFGRSVSVGANIVVGAYLHPPGSSSGAAYVFAP